MYSQAVVSLVFMRSSCSSEPRQLMDGDMNDIQWRSTSSGEHGLKASDAGVIEWRAKTCAREASGVEVLGVPHSTRKGSRPRLHRVRVACPWVAQKLCVRQPSAHNWQDGGRRDQATVT